MEKENIQKKGVKVFLISLAIVLFFTSYWICDYYYPYDIERPREFDSKGWWALKTKIYAIIIALVFLVSSFNKEKWLRFVCEIGCGLAISNFIDKCFYDVLVFTKSDIYMILITVAFATYNLIYGDKQRTVK